LKIKKYLTFENFKIAAGALLLTVLLIFGKTMYRDYQEKDRHYQELLGKEEKYNQITEHLAASEIKYQTQDRLVEKYQIQFSEYKKSSNQRIKILSNATFMIRERAKKQGRSDLVYEGKNVKYVFDEIRFKDGPPIGYVMIFDDGRVVKKIYNHIIDIKTAVLRDEDTGRYEILSKADYRLRSGHRKPDGVNWFNKPYPLKITGGTALIDPTEKNPMKPRFHLFSPRLSASIHSGASPDGFFVKPSLGISISGYGPSKRDLDFKFLH